jgi:uncharacterized phage protein gp47/JayE
MATLLDFLPLFQESAASIRARVNTDANAGLDVDDPRWVDTREGTFFHDVTEPLVQEFARLYDLLSVEVPAAAFPVFAWGEYLDAHAEVFDLTRKPEAAASVEITFYGEPGTVIGTGAVVSADQTDEAGDPIEFSTVESGVIGARIDVPAFTVTPTAGAPGTYPAGTTFYYAVTAVNATGETTANEVEGVATATDTRFVLDWPDVAGATSYRVYRGTVEGGNKNVIYDGATSTYTDSSTPTLGAAGPPEIDTTGAVALLAEAAEAGEQGNLAAHAITNLDSPIAGIDKLHNLEAAAGGAEEELDEALRERILLEYEGHGAGNITDYKRWALAEPGVGQVFVNPVWNGPGTVQVVVMDSNGDPVGPATVSSLQTKLDPTVGTADGLAPVGITVTVQTPTQVPIDVAATIDFEDGYSLDGGGGTIALRERIEQALSSYIDELEVGEDVVYNHVQAAFFRVEGIYDVSAVTVEGATADVSITVDPPQVATLGAVLLTA